MIAFAFRLATEILSLSLFGITLMVIAIAIGA